MAATANPSAKIRRSVVIGIATFAVFALLASLIYLPAGPLSTGRIPGGGFDDPPQLAFYLAWIPYALAYGLSLISTNYVNYPGGINLATNTTVPLLGLLAAPITLTLGPIAAVNLLLHLAFTLSAGSMYLVLRAWVQRWIPAFLGGLFYGFSPYMITQAEGNAHLDLLFIPLLPVIVWCVYELVIVGRREPVRLGLLLGVLAAAQVLIDAELLSELALLLFIGLVCVAAAHQNEVRPRLPGVALGVAVAAVVFLVLGGGAYMWGVFFGTDHLTGPVQAANFLQWYRADLLGAIIPTSHQLLAPASLVARANQFDHGDITENAAYLGVPVLVVLVAIVVVLRRNAAIRLIAGLATVSYLFSLGTPLTIDNHATGIPLIGAVTSHVPIVDNFLPARFAAFVALFSAILLAIGIDRALAAVAKSDRRFLRLGGLGIAGAASVAVLVPNVPLTTAPLPWPASLTKTIRAVPPGSVVLTYPYPITPWSGPMLWQAEDQIRFRIIGGYAVFRTKSGVGNTGPPLLAPADVEEFLLGEQEGAASYFPQPTASVTKRQRDLCVFLNKYSVNAVVFWGAGDDPAAVKNYFATGLGAPTVSSNGVLVWLTSETGCRP